MTKNACMPAQHERVMAVLPILRWLWLTVARFLSIFINGMFRMPLWNEEPKRSLCRPTANAPQQRKACCLRVSTKFIVSATINI